MTPTISVIVPVHNTARYLDRCITSITSQTMDSFELILIEDGSSDESGAICDRYAAKDSRISVQHHECRGVSTARNHGLDAAHGKYVAFVDSDDYVAKDYLEQLYQAMQGNPSGATERTTEYTTDCITKCTSNSVDLSICAFSRIRSDSSELVDSPEHVPSPGIATSSDTFSLDTKCRMMNQDTLIEQVLCNNQIGGYLWNKLYRMELIRKYDIRMKESLSIGEDMVFLMEYMTHCQTGRYISRPLYGYRLNTDSALQAMYHTGVFNKKKLSNLAAAAEIKDICERYLLSASLSSAEQSVIKQAYRYRMTRTGMWTIFNTLKCNYYEKELLRSICKDYLRTSYRYYLKSPYSKHVERIFAVCFACMPCVSWKMSHLALCMVPKRLVQKYLG